MTVVVVLIDPSLGLVLPAAALPHLRSGIPLYATSGVPADLVAASGAVPAPSTVDGPAVLLATDLTEPQAAALYAAGAEVIAAPSPVGIQLLHAATVMDRLRGPGGCPWDAEQTHDSLRKYLVEETFELLEAIEENDRAMLREELGDVLLQVLFHARIAAESTVDGFTIDDVAGELVTKLVSRHPHVFAGGDPAVHDAASQERRWDELKKAEKSRDSAVDGVPLGQPAIALAAKLVSRVTKAGFPEDLLPGSGDTGATLFAIAALAALSGEDPESELRAVARRFAADVRATESTARAAGIDPHTMDADTWRVHWPES
jgi:XTP/dITP diphosphohydrolase